MAPLALVAAGAAAIYGALTIWYLAKLPAWGRDTDFFLRWQEIRYVFQGIDPRDVSQGVVAAAVDVGIPGANYAPWSYVLGALFIPPLPQSAAFVVFLTWNVFALILAGAWAQQMCRDHLYSLRALPTLALLGTLAIPVTLRHLNYSVVVLGCLAAFLLLDRSGQRVLAGAALGLTMVKPQLGALFFLVPFVRRSWVTAASAVGVVLAAWLASAALVAKTPWRLLLEMFREGAGYTNAYLGLLDPLLRLGVARSNVVLLGVTVVGFAAGATLLAHRRRPAWVQVAAVAAFTLSWTYQRSMDQLLIGLLVIALLRFALLTGTRRSVAVVGTIGASFWLPYLSRMNFLPVVPELFRAIWLAGAVFLLRATKGVTGEEPKP